MKFLDDIFGIEDKGSSVWVLELDDARARYVLGVHSSIRGIERYLHDNGANEYEKLERNGKVVYRTPNQVRYIATIYTVK